MKEIKIVSRWDSEKVILCGKYESIKECLEKNRDSNLSGSNLRGSNLSYSDLSYSNLSGSNLRGSNLSYSDLSYSDLSGSNLSGSNLRGSNLSGSNLSGSINYKNSHDFFQEAIRRQKVDIFTDKEWSCIGQIIIHKLCWDSIKKKFDETAMKVFKKLSKVGFDEWEKGFNTIRGK